MTDTMELQQLEDDATAPATLDGDTRLPRDLRRLSEVPVDVAVEIGRTRMTVGETLDLRQGSIIHLNRMAGEPVDLLVNGTLIARGEVVVIDEQFGMRITIVLGDRDAPAGSVAPDAPKVEVAEAA
jgi:flagellar motor switch protein FliN/FliY